MLIFLKVLRFRKLGADTVTTNYDNVFGNAPWSGTRQFMDTIMQLEEAV